MLIFYTNVTCSAFGTTCTFFLSKSIFACIYGKLLLHLATIANLAGVTAALAAIAE
jgi:hypothetical protein